jgi:hypothetical protein
LRRSSVRDAENPRDQRKRANHQQSHDFFLLG